MISSYNFQDFMDFLVTLSPWTWPPWPTPWGPSRGHERCWARGQSHRVQLRTERVRASRTVDPALFRKPRWPRWVFGAKFFEPQSAMLFFVGIEDVPFEREILRRNSRNFISLELFPPQCQQPPDSPWLFCIGPQQYPPIHFYSGGWPCRTQIVPIKLPSAVV